MAQKHQDDVLLVFQDYVDQILLFQEYPLDLEGKHKQHQA